MTITNAIKKLERAGFTVTEDNRRFTATKEGLRRFIEFIPNGGTNDIAVIDLRTKGHEDDPNSDYHAGTFCDNITQAIQYATTW